MRFKLYLVLFYLLTSTILSAQEKSEESYIQLRYAGEQISMHPVITFYLPGSFDTSIIRGGHYSDFPISQRIFEIICEVIENRKKVSKDTTLNWMYEFTIVYNGEFRIFHTPYLSRIKEIYSRIDDQFENEKTRKSLTYYLGIALAALRYEYKWQIPK